MNSFLCRFGFHKIEWVSGKILKYIGKEHALWEETYICKHCGREKKRRKVSYV